MVRRSSRTAQSPLGSVHPLRLPVQSGSAPKDMSDYFAACRARLHDPAAVSFLSARGINIKTAETYGLGFGPKADPAGSHRCCPRITIPTNCFHYVARSIDPDAQPGCRTMNSLGVSPTLFNRRPSMRPAMNRSLSPRAHSMHCLLSRQAAVRLRSIAPPMVGSC